MLKNIPPLPTPDTLSVLRAEWQAHRPDDFRPLRHCGNLLFCSGVVAND
jgi:hypothetical protein